MEQMLSVLRPEERIAIQLRALYKQRGFNLFRLSSFEEYNLYLENKAFLTNDDAITFTGNDGRLMALNPDVTLSIVKNTSVGENRRVYYNEDVYRHDRKNGIYKRINQIGLEVIGPVAQSLEVEVLQMAIESLALVGDAALDVSHVGVVEDVVAQFTDSHLKKQAVAALRTKSPHKMRLLCQEAKLSKNRQEALVGLTTLSGDFMTVLPQAQSLAKYLPKTLQALDELEQLNQALADSCKAMEKVKLRLDFSIVNDTDYYSGLLFQGFLESLPHAVLFGGRYDHLLQKQGKNKSAIGFAMYLNGLDRIEEKAVSDTYLSVALPKGRMGTAIYRLFVQAGLVDEQLFDESRKLIFEDKENKIRFFLVKPSDVDKYVEQGAADIGVAGYDILAENNLDVLELLDLQLGRCRMAVAGKADFVADSTASVRVATKYPNITRDYYSKIGQAVELIHLHGSIELAPLLDLSDVIVDIVETGSTLKENNLVILKEIMPSSARLIANRTAWRFKKEAISKLVQKVEAIL